MTNSIDNGYEQTRDFAEVNGIQLHYALDGDNNLPVLALVNMASHNLTCWEPVLAELVKSFRVLRFDIRGTGKSHWSDDDAFTFTQYADDLCDLLTKLEIPAAYVVGVAYGARTAARFAIRHPAKLSALGLFDVALTPPVEQTNQRALGEQAQQLLQQAGLQVPAREKYWRFYENREAALKAHTAHEQEPDTTEMLKHLSVPVIVACGRQDMNLSEAQRIAAAIPQADLRIMEMTGHGSPFFRPDLFAEFIKRVEIDRN